MAGPDLVDRFGPAVVGYLDTPSMGVPTAATIEAMERGLRDWYTGRARYETWEESVERCRLGWAALTGADPAAVGTVGSVVPPLSAVLAALASRGGDVVVHADEFRSLLLPALAAYGTDRVRWVTGPYGAEGFESRLDERVGAVVVCSVASGNGARPDLARLVDAADRVGAAVVVDSTQSEGIVGLGAPVSRFAAVAAAGYKGLLGPRGTGYVHVRADVDLAPILPASPYGMADNAVRGSYGGPAVPYEGGRGLTQSPAWLSYVGAEPGMALLREQPAGERERHVLALADALRGALLSAGIRTEHSDLPSPIVSVPLRASTPVMRALERAGVRAAVRLSRLRLGLHLYTTQRDVDVALHALLSVDREHFERT